MVADKDPEGDEPSLELPSFGFGRRKGRKRKGRMQAPEAAPPPRSEPAAGPGPTPTPVVPEPAPEPLDRPLQELPPTPPLPVASTERRTAPVEAASDRPVARGTGAVDTVEDTRPVAPRTRRERREVRFPSLPALPAVLLVGAVVGLTAVLLTYGSLRLCDVATGTASCGGGPGLLLMLAILIALTYLGGWLLRGLGIDDAGSTSFLAVALLAVVAMLFLVDSLDESAGAIWVVVVTIAAYAVAWRGTTALVDADADTE